MIIEVINHLTTPHEEQVGTDSDKSDHDKLDRACLFGDGFFTTGIIVDHQLCYQNNHMERLLESANKLRFNGFSISSIKQSIAKLSEQNANASIRISISRRQNQRGYAISKQAEYCCTIHISELLETPQVPCELLDATVSISHNKDLAGIKHLNRLDSVLAASEISNNNQEVLMYHDDQVICGSRSNLFVKLNKEWLTPKLDSAGVKGLTRQRVLDVFNEKKIKYQVTNITRKQLTQVSAAFVTNSLIGLWPAKSVNGCALDVGDSDQLRKLITRT